MDPPRVPVVKITTVKVKGHRQSPPFNGFFYFIIKFCLYDCILFPLLSYRCSYVAEVLSIQCKTQNNQSTELHVLRSIQVS